MATATDASSKPKSESLSASVSVSMELDDARLLLQAGESSSEEEPDDAAIEFDDDEEDEEEDDDDDLLDGLEDDEELAQQALAGVSGGGGGVSGSGSGSGSASSGDSLDLEEQPDAIPLEHTLILNNTTLICPYELLFTAADEMDSGTTTIIPDKYDPQLFMGKMVSPAAAALVQTYTQHTDFVSILLFQTLRDFCACLFIIILSLRFGWKTCLDRHASDHWLT